MSLMALIFDVDGTLAETEEAHRKAFNDTFAHAGVGWHWSREDYRWLLRTTGGKERIRRYLVESGSACPGDDAIALLHRRKTVRYAEIVAGGELSLRPGVRELVAQARLAGLSLAVATTTNRPNVDTLCELLWGCPAGNVFDVIAAGDEVVAKKPAPDVYELALARLGMEPGDAVAFEDSRNGLLSARKAGLRTVVTPSSYTQGEDFSGADWFLPDLRSESLPKELRMTLAHAALPSAE
ncbi:HAD family hydrolase [Tropicimonas sediminicola]|uniref:Haloacid dehalogenase superfamily, subfamily IA, variant 3 with third motif having DD or ED n=1 Tax=Tropicimonas sediminicola TaxID=1031541 RepID=A0A239MFR5_9RHOB|nr:HAD family hydrolase [Tropicimonas sediminicola]SNT41501.1 haloacid dehalogenase superfamily, subfamily IA, variant 3 with third motif having DD or ED [Tropicimonas sediminicola]